QRGNDFERGIFRRRPNQPDVSLLYVWKKCVLLSFIEAMNLVNENNRASAILPRPLRVGHHLFDFFDPGKHGAELDKLRASHTGNDFCQSGLARTRWSPEDQ